LLMDEYGYGWDEAWAQVNKCIAYTNHTVMPEALERWPVQYVQTLLPRIYMIIEEINRRFNAYMAEKGVDPDKRYQMQIIKDGQIHMTNMAIYAGFSVNGVAKIHTNILETYTFKNFYELFPEKFNNKTNGVTHRRWLLYSNEKLANLITSKIGEDWIKHPEKLEAFKAFADDKATQKALMEVKHENKVDFAKFVKANYDIDIDPNSIYDTQIKRLHAYKRQLMNLFHIMYLYQKLKENPSAFKMPPHTYIFGAKAAPSYEYAKRIIELILAVANVVNNDPDANKFMKIVFVENYGVSLAERIIPASDLSEQISTAGKEASGTSNMKLMMNGAVTIGTLDGANIEIADLAGRSNEIIFGLKADEVQKITDAGTYNPWDIYNKDPRVKNVMDSLLTGPWALKSGDRFRMIFDEVLNHGDQYFILADFDAYCEACDEADAYYSDKAKWAHACICNIAMSGYFSSDRTVEQYNKDIWHLSKFKVEPDE
jgi:starch phosphorylase